MSENKDVQSWENVGKFLGLNAIAALGVGFLGALTKDKDNSSTTPKGGNQTRQK